VMGAIPVVVIVPATVIGYTLLTRNAGLSWKRRQGAVVILGARSRQERIAIRLSCYRPLLPRDIRSPDQDTKKAAYILQGLLRGITPLFGRPSPYQKMRKRHGALAYVEDDA
jgi:hypothetical protein